MIYLLIIFYGLWFVKAIEYTTYPPLPKFLTNNPLPHGKPWGTANATNTHPDYGVPNTGVTRFYKLSVSRQSLSPDGYNKQGILINNQFPGPLIEANWGDTLHIEVTNDIKDEGTALHWHGQPQRLKPAADGVPSVQQCPIAPGKSHTYVFRAEQYGSSWYHSHFSGQYMDGAFGPLVVYGPRTEEYDQDLGPILLTDYYHEDYYNSTVRSLKIPPIFDRSDNNLINGRMDLNCVPNSNSSTGPCEPSKLSQFKFESGKTYLLRLINAGVTMNQKFTIDGHELTIIANDYVPVVPYTTRVVTLGVGQRADVLVKATGRPTDLFWMRSDLDDVCQYLNGLQFKALAVVSYSKAPKHKLPATKPTHWDSYGCRNDPLNSTTPQYPTVPPINVATTQEINVDAYVNETGFLIFHMNNQTFRANYNYPVLLLAKVGNTSYPYDPQWNVYNFGQNISIRAIIYNYFFMPHPIHLHGHNFWVLSEGHGRWDGTITNPENPQRRDVQLIPPGTGTADNPGYLVLEWEADNPGVWPLHCHIVSDVSLGLYINIMERPDLIVKRDILMTAAETCRHWWKFTEHEFVNQIDSGL